MEFKELAEERRKVREICRKHVPSLLEFLCGKGPQFNIFSDDPEPKDGQLHHITNTATCIESLGDCHLELRQQPALKTFTERVKSTDERLVEDLTRAFTSAAGKPEKEWYSEESAPVYCACRGFTLFLEGSTTWTAKHTKLVKQIYKQSADPSNPMRFGIGEEKVSPSKRPPPKKEERWYPENAYHTYWSLKVLHKIRSKPFQSAALKAFERLHFSVDRLSAGMLLWARAKLGEEIALHWEKKSTLDSDQLTWALTTFIEFVEGDLSSDLRSQDLVRKAFQALASTQEPVGVWRHYRPLFVYSNVGNAYCYVYESFAYLLKAVLTRIETDEFLEAVIRGFLENLQNLRKYAEMTQVVKGRTSEVLSWSSGHRPADPKPEGWATASVFSFLQAYRRILGVLARRDALRKLPNRPHHKFEDPVQELGSRGETWSHASSGTSYEERMSAGERLVTLFVNPILSGVSSDGPEPDDQPIGKADARSAILFGPPGTSKTTLARCVAEALGWKYVELYSSDFVAEGIDAIQRTADSIFGYLMELDHTVVLFDEPDELVREREGSPDFFGRFLTTSMLPKLAELSNQRSVIYFVATNHIKYFDAAIVRSGRFDLVLPVPPPSYNKKRERLERCLNELGFAKARVGVPPADIESKLTELAAISGYRRVPPAEDLPCESQLAKFVLLRWDQLEELAALLAELIPASHATTIDKAQLEGALGKVADQRLSKLQTYLDYMADRDYARRDFERKPVFSVRQCPTDSEIRKG